MPAKLASHHIIYATTRMKCEAIYATRALHSVIKMCEALKISQCQYYQWIRFQGNRDKRKNREIWLVEAIRRIFIENREVYGCRKIKKALETEGIFVSEWKIRRIMRENGFYPQTRKKWKPYRKAKSNGMYSENKVKRHFLPDRFNELWAGDITYIPTNMGWFYLVAVLDLKNKEVIGYEVSKNIDSELCKRALANALALRGRHKGLVFHSDRGSQYSSRAYKSMLAENGIESSMSEPGCPYDNSCVESFFATLKKEMTQLQD